MAPAPSRSGVRLVAVAMAFLLPVVYSTSVAAQAWTPRVALVLVLGAFGLPRLSLLIRSDARPAALAAIAFLAVAALATALSPQPILSVFGLYNWGTGLLFVAALVGAWALGASVDGAGTEPVENALIAGVLVNAIVAVVQGGFSLGVDPFTRFEGRAAGLLGNPVYLATLAAGGLALVLPRVNSNLARWGSATVLVAAALELSGSRSALAIAVVVGIVMLVRERRNAIRPVAALALGLVLGAMIGFAGGATTGSGRVQAGGESVGTTARLHLWASAGHAVANRPVLGSGPGLFGAATSRYRDLALVHAEGADRRLVDAHNVVVEYATTTGLLGLSAVGVWLFLACRRAAGPLLWFAVLVFAMHLVEPQAVSTTPLALLALGVAGRADVRRAGRGEVVATAALVVMALLAATRLVWGDFEFRQAGLDFRGGPADAAARALSPWVEPAQVAGRVALYRSITTQAPQARRDALGWNRQATRRNSRDPDAWSSLAEAQLYFGQPRSAARSFREALRWDPWSVRALNGLANAELAQGDKAPAVAALQKSLRADANQTKIKAQLARL